VQCPHFIAFHALGIIVGIAVIVVGIAQDGVEVYAQKDLYANIRTVQLLIIGASRNPQECAQSQICVNHKPAKPFCVYTNL